MVLGFAGGGGGWCLVWVFLSLNSSVSQVCVPVALLVTDLGAL